MLVLLLLEPYFSSKVLLGEKSLYVCFSFIQTSISTYIKCAFEEILYINIPLSIGAYTLLILYPPRSLFN